MAFQKLAQGFAPMVEFKKKGDSVTGYLMAVRGGVGKNKSNVYTLERENGDSVEMWGSGAIDWQLTDQKSGQIRKGLVGVLVRVTFQGVRKLDKKRTLKQFDVEADTSKRRKPARAGKVPF